MLPSGLPTGLRVDGLDEVSSKVGCDRGDVSLEVRGVEVGIAEGLDVVRRRRRRRRGTGVCARAGGRGWVERSMRVVEVHTASKALSVRPRSKRTTWFKLLTHLPRY